ncbi:uncharacterized protein LOC110647751 [Hevea brasiliensis]|uniref:uncharacterized protein LOC110647751 n=1 Tax=Hevea brasiliensis TaxID=3981 RepID=UPI0025DE0D7F|nr:uncharacterized protein LOC110647751 [Hevea brasiliensis]
MTLWIFRTLVLLSRNTSQLLHKPPALHSVSLLFFSAFRSTESKPKTTIFDYLINQLQFSPESASVVSSSTTKYLIEPQNADSVLNFLIKNGFSKAHIENVVRRVPRILSASLENKIKPKIKIFRDLGFNSIDVADIVSADPWILDYSADNKLGPSILALKNVLGSDADVSTLLKISGWFLKKDLERTLIPNIKYLKSCGISSSQIFGCVFNFPRFFLEKPENIKEFVRRVDEMGVDRKSKTFLPAIRVLGSMTKENWERKLKLFRELGFSEDNILFAFGRVAQVLAVSERKIKEVTQLLLSVENINISYIICHPEFVTSELLRSE